jgi:multicomponent Na+:H+ antiporter subunit G
MIEIVLQTIGSITIVFGLFFMFVGSIGLIRLPDFYTRLHATSKTDTLGIGLIFIGLMFFAGPTQATLKLLLIIAFIFFTSPVSAHAIAKAAYKSGLKPYQKKPEEEHD